MNVAKSLQITKLNCDICKKEISSKYKFKLHKDKNSIVLTVAKILLKDLI